MKPKTAGARFVRVAMIAATLSITFFLVIMLQSSMAGELTTEDINRADVVVDLGDGHSITQRVSFSTTQISGLEALLRTGLNVTTAEFGFGTAVCAIEGVGCPATDCFCETENFWGYQYWEEGGWQSYMVGAADSNVSDGGVEGWAWGPFGNTPPAITSEILAANAALQWIAPQQETDGSIGHNVGATLDVILAVAAANQDPVTWRSSEGESLVDYVKAEGSVYAGQTAAGAGKMAVGAAAAHQDPAAFGDLDLVDILDGHYDSGTGAFGANNQDQGFALLGLAAAGEMVPEAAVQRLVNDTNPDGGWGWAGGVPSDVDSTSLVIEALIAAGQSATSTVVVNALDYLHDVQMTNTDGGFASSPDQPWAVDSNTNSTAFAVQAILATAGDPLSNAWAISNTHPIGFLLGQQLPDGGFVYVDPPANLFATQQAPPALVGKPFPLLSRAVAQRRALAWMDGQQQADGSFAGFNPGATIDAVFAIVSASQNPLDFVSSQGNTPLDYLAIEGPAYAAQGANAAGKLTLGVVAAGLDPGNFSGINLVDVLWGYFAPATGQFGAGTTWDQAFAMLGLVAAGETLPDEAAQYLLDIRSAGGGWGFTANSDTPEVDSTSVSLQALAATGVNRQNEGVADGLAFLYSQQNPDGGFPGFGGETSPGSTGLALQAIAACGESPVDLSWTRIVTDGTSSRLTLRTPYDSLLVMQSPEGGFPGYTGSNDPFSTYQALPGLAFKALPLSPPGRVFFPVVGVVMANR
ncbi:MAG: prenyltransferase/squalene oxidase repeat-containing protein [Chloroflexota bacterium]|nr:prenyltransferase/squalene oxidase repeat-containing protein [Chloroflexota bacterium]